MSSFSLSLDNVTDNWQNELMSLAQQVRTSFKTFDQTSRTPSSRLTTNTDGARLTRRMTMQYSPDEHLISKRLWNRSTPRHSRLGKSENLNEKISVDTPNQQDHGIWVRQICFNRYRSTTFFPVVTHALSYLTNRYDC